MSRSVTTIVAVLAAAAPAAAGGAECTAAADCVGAGDRDQRRPSRRGRGTTPPANGGRVSTLPSFTYPSDGSVVVSGASSASAAIRRGGSTASSQASSSVSDVSLFDGEVTASSVSAAASAATRPGSASGKLGGVTVVGLQALGRPVRRGWVALGDWGRLTVEQRSAASTAPHGVEAYAGSVAAIEVTLSRAHAGLPPGSSVGLRGRLGTRRDGSAGSTRNARRESAG